MIQLNEELLACVSRLVREGKAKGIVEKCLQPGEYLTRQDAPLYTCYILKKGVAKCFISEDNGKSYILEFLGRGAIIGELEFLNDTLCLSTIEALGELHVYKFTREYFDELLVKNRVFNRLILQELARRVRLTARRAAFQQIYSTEQTVLKLMQLLSDSAAQLSKQDLADYLGITLRSLNRSLHDLRSKGLLPPE